MINDFKSIILGTFDNRRQAYSNPSLYAHIRLTHKEINEKFLYGEQAYTYQLDKPYRQFVLEIIQESNCIRVVNYEVLNKSKYLGFKNLDQFDKSEVRVNSGCDLIFKSNTPNLFVGGTVGCNCIIRDSYLESRITITPSQYVVIDRGFCVESHIQLWGSEHGEFIFDKI